MRERRPPPRAFYPDEEPEDEWTYPDFNLTRDHCRDCGHEGHSKDECPLRLAAINNKHT